MKNVERVYLSGPMTNIEDHNYPRFIQVASQLRGMGFIVFNPAEQYPGQPRSELLRNDISLLARADAIVMLEGWQKSRGACLELAIARELELPVFYWPVMVPVQNLPFVGTIVHEDKEIPSLLLYAGKPMPVVVGGPDGCRTSNATSAFEALGKPSDLGCI